MKIRNKFIISFSLTGSVLLLLFGLTIYFFTAYHRKEEFNKRLTRRVNITEKMFLEKDHFSKENFEKIRKQFLHNLPKEKNDVIEIKTSDNSKLANYPDHFIKTILDKEIAYYQEGERQWAGKYFHLNDGNYLVLVSAIDVVGIEKLTYLKGIIITATLIGIVFFSILSIPLSKRIINPLSYKIKVANAISENNLHKRLTGITSNDEIGQLAGAFNNLLGRIERAFEAKKAFISNASHEIRNPLNSIINEADLSLQQERTKNEYREALKSIAGEGERMRLLVDNLLELSNIKNEDTTYHFEYLPLIPLLNEVIEKFQLTIRLGNRIRGFGGIEIWSFQP
ncbi:MAG: histidine kinase dimerization/phospho-acceptor domain-containing protein [Flavobacteriales bacterium]